MDRIDLISGFLVTEGSVPALVLEVARLSTSEANSSVGQVWVETSSRSLLLILLILGVQLIAMVWVSVGVAKGLDRVYNKGETIAKEIAIPCRARQLWYASCNISPSRY